MPERLSKGERLELVAELCPRGGSRRACDGFELARTRGSQAQDEMEPAVSADGGRGVHRRSGRSGGLLLEGVARHGAAWIADLGWGGGGGNNPGGVVGKAVLEISRHRYSRGLHHAGPVIQRLVASHRAVQAAKAGGEAAAGRGQRLKSELLEHLGRADVPSVGHQQWGSGTMEL